MTDRSGEEPSGRSNGLRGGRARAGPTEAFDVDVLIPTFERPGPLAVTLASLVGQTLPRFRVVVADQSEGTAGIDAREVRAVGRVLQAQGRRVELLRNLPRRGMAHQRQFLLDRARGRYALFVDDDVVLEPDLVERMLRAIREHGCGFVGSALIGLTYENDERSQEHEIEFWDGPVRPEEVRPGEPEWARHRVHNAANLLHLQRRLGVTADRQRLYKVAWVGGCVLYDVAALRECGGYEFWEALPSVHSGEDVAAQLRVMARFGGCGLMPSGAYHQELPTTVPDRRVDAPYYLSREGVQERR